jgi:transposase
MKKHIKVTEGKKLQVVQVQDSAKQRVSSEVREVLEKLGVGTNRGDARRSRKRQSCSSDRIHCGVDLGDKKSNYCYLDATGKILIEGSLATTQKEFGAYFEALPKMTIALEVGTHSAWVSALLESYGHEVVVANTRKMESIHKNRRKNDKVDARTLARLVRADPELLYPIRHRGAEVRQDLVMLRARDALVSVRTKLINCTRGLVKSVGGRLPKCSADSFHKRVAESIPEKLQAALVPLLAQIELLTAKIREYDVKVSRMADEKYPETMLLKQVEGVGDLTSVVYILTLEKRERFEKSRDVGCYLGLIPRQDDSGESSPQLRITKTGDKMLRRLLVGSVHYILGPFGKDCDLRRFGMKLAARGGKNAKKRAVVAVARKLAVLLHRLWVTGEEYEPLRQARLQEEALEAVV